MPSPAHSDALAPPWPDLLIATGRHSVAASLYVRAQSRRAGRRTVTVQVQDPVISPSHFDLVITPQHDRLRGANVVTTMGALHRVTAAKLGAEADRLAPRVADLPRPYVGVLIGGANSAYDFGAAEMTSLANALVTAAKECGGSLLITPSRRTGEANLAILRQVLADTPNFLWDGDGDNPYFGILGLADQLVVTSDSVNMVSEAVASGRPVQVFELPGGSDKFARFHSGLRESGLTHAFTGTLAVHDPAIPADDMARAAEAVRAVLARRR